MDDRDYISITIRDAANKFSTEELEAMGYDTRSAYLLKAKYSKDDIIRRFYWHLLRCRGWDLV